MISQGKGRSDQNVLKNAMDIAASDRTLAAACVSLTTSQGCRQTSIVGIPPPGVGILSDWGEEEEI